MDGLMDGSMAGTVIAKSSVLPMRSSSLANIDENNAMLSSHRILYGYPEIFMPGGGGVNAAPVLDEVPSISNSITNYKLQFTK